MKNLKKKVALMLALVMMLSLVPTMNVFGILAPPGTPGDIALGAEVQINTGQLVGFVANTSGNQSYAQPGASFLEITLQNVGGTRGFNPIGTTGAAIVAPPVSGIDPAGSFWVVQNRTTLHVFLAHDDRAVLTALTPGALNIDLPAITADADDWNATITVRQGAGGTILYGPHGLFLAPEVPRGIEFTINEVQFGGGRLGVAFLNDLVLTERSIGSFEAGNYVAVSLLAPADYIWQNVTPALVTPNPTRDGASVVDSERLTHTDADGNVFPNRIMQIVIDPGTRIGGTMGRLAIEDLRLTAAPGVDPLPVQTLSVNARARAVNSFGPLVPTVGNDTLGNLGANATRWYNNIDVANRVVGGFTTTVTPDPAPMLTSGMPVAWSGTLRIQSNAPGSFMNDQHVFVDFNQPGITVVGARFQVRSADQDLLAWDHSNVRTYANEAHRDRIVVGNDRVRFTAENIQNYHDTTNRYIAMQFQLRIDPAFVAISGDTEIEATINMRGNYDDIDRVETIARVQDPITLSAEEPVEVSTVGDVFAFIPPTQVADVTVEETAVGALVSGQWLYVYVVPTINGRVLPNLFGSDVDFETNLRPTTTGRLTLQQGQRVPSAQLPDEFRGVPVFRFRVATASTGNEPGSITFTDNFVGGSLLHARLPDVDFTFVVAGPALTRGLATVDDVANRLNTDAGRMPYTTVIGTVGDRHVPDAELITPPPVGPGPRPVEAPEYYVFALTRDHVLPYDGSQAVVVDNGRPMVGLRFFGEEILGGDVDWVSADRTVIMNAIGAHGGNVSFTLVAGENTAQVSIRGETPDTRPVSGIRTIGGRNFIPLSAVSQIFGFGVTEVNGTWYITE